MKKIIKLSLFCFVVLAIPVSFGESRVVGGMTSAELREAMKISKPSYLKKLQTDRGLREEYIASLYFRHELEVRAREAKLFDDSSVIAKLRASQDKILIDELMHKEIKKLDVQIDALAKERYEATKKSQKTRRRIKIALISINKELGKEEEAKREIEELYAKLSSPDVEDKVFSELAKKHSDDKSAIDGGVLERWIIEPKEINTDKKIVSAAFALGKNGEITDIVELKHSYNLIKLLAERPSHVIPYATAKNGIKKNILSSLWSEKLAELKRSLSLKDTEKVDDKVFLEVLEETLANEKE